MTPRAKLAVTFVLLALLGSLGAADYYLSGSQYAAFLTQGAGDTPDDVVDVATTPTDSTVPAGAVAKAKGPNVEDIAREQSMELRPGNDLTLLAQVASDGPAVQSFALMKDQDRIGSVAWIESSAVKETFTALKEALIAAFSPGLQDLKDETIQGADKPTRNLLTFLDPSLSEERIVFIRVRERLYEFHVALGKEPAMNEFVEIVTTR